MKITSQKEVDHTEIVTHIDVYEYDVRVQIKSGVMVTMKCTFEDGDFLDWEAKTTKDRKIIDKLSSAELNYMVTLFEGIVI